MELNEPDIDPEAHKQKLIEEAEKADKERKARVGSIIQSVQEGEEYTETESEWVSVGEVDFEVLTTLPGKVQDIMEYHDHPDPEERTRTRDLIEEMPSLVLAIDDPQEGLIEDPVIVQEFFLEYYEVRGADVFEEIIEPLMQPARETMERRVPESFRGSTGGTRNGFRDVDRAEYAKRVSRYDTDRERGNPNGRQSPRD
jgi:hypothetical protein